MRFDVILAASAGILLAPAALAQRVDDAPRTFEGQLEDSDVREGADGPVVSDQHRIRLEAGRRYRISAESEDFDPIIRLYQEGEDEPVAENDDYDPQESLNARVTYTPEETAEYVLHVISFSETGRGPYEARVERLPPLPAPVSGRPDDRAQTSWQMWDGALSESDPERDGAYFDDYRIRMRAGETRIISAEAPGFDPLLWVLRAEEREGEPIDVDDDAGPATNAMLGFRPEDDGDYIVRVTSYGGAATGPYRLRISEPLTPPPPGPPEEPEEPEEPDDPDEPDEPDEPDVINP